MLSGMLIQETFCPDLKFRYSHESSCSQGIFSLLCRPKRQWKNTRTSMYLHERSLQTVRVDSCYRQDPCSSNWIKNRAALGWKGNFFVCWMLFPPFLYRGITVNKKGNKGITIDLFTFFFFHQRSFKKKKVLPITKATRSFQFGQRVLGVDYINLHTLELHVHTETGCWEPKVSRSIQDSSNCPPLKLYPEFTEDNATNAICIYSSCSGSVSTSIKWLANGSHCGMLCRSRR